MTRACSTGACGCDGDALRKGAERVRCVLDSILLDVELAELLVHAELVLAAHRRVDVRRDRRVALQVGQRNARHAERVFGEFAVGARQPRQLRELALVAAACQLQVQHAEEGLQRLFEPSLLEERPAVHVQRTLVERRAASALHRHRIGFLRPGIVAQREQQLAAAELRLVPVRRPGILLHQLVERLQRRLQVPAQLVRAGQLVEHAVVARIVRIGLQEGLVLPDRGLVVGGGPCGLPGGHARVDGVHLEIAQAAQRLLAMRLARRRPRGSRGTRGLPPARRP